MATRVSTVRVASYRRFHSLPLPLATPTALDRLLRPTSVPSRPLSPGQRLPHHSLSRKLHISSLVSASPIHRRPQLTPNLPFKTPQSRSMAFKGGNFELLCLENPLLDIQGQGDQEMLEKYGLKANDAILAEPKHSGLYEDLLQNRNAKLIAGGAAQNTARGAQYMLPPDSAVYIGCVGKDKYADILKDAVKQVGLRVEYRYDEKEPTGRCGVIITGHNRSMCTDLAAANCYKLEHLKQPEIWKLVDQAKVFYVGGYHLTVCPPAAMALAEDAAAKNKIFIFSISAPFIPQFFKEPLDQTAPYWDYVVGNETEALAFAQSHDLKTEKIPDIATAMAKLPKKNKQRPRVAIITQGTDPTIVATADADGEVKIEEFPVHPIDKAEICDTTGAGDAFAGGFAAGVVQGKPLKECINMGQWLAKLSIRELGPSYPFPKQTYSGSS